MTNLVAPPPKLKRMTNFPPPLFHVPSSLSFASLPDEIVVSFLARIPRSYYRSLCLVSKRFYSLLYCLEMYAARSQIGATEPCLYVSLRLPTLKNHHRWFTLVNPFEGELSLAPVRLSSSYAPARLNSTIVTVGFEIYHIGGTVGDRRSRAVRVLDCRNHTWRHAPNLKVARKRAKSCFLDGKIYVIGGEEESMNWGEVFDIKTQTWKPLPVPSDKGVDPKHQVLVFGARLYVFTKHNKYAYDPKEGRWLPDVAYEPKKGRWLRDLGLDVGLRQPILPDVGLDMGLLQPRISGPCCIIKNVMVADRGGKYKWYNSTYGVWLMVENLGVLYSNRAREYQTIQLVNHGGKLVIIWHERFKILDERGIIWTDDKKIWCAVIRLEVRFTLETQIWGEVEQCNVVVPRVPKSYKLLACRSVLL